MNHVLEGLTNYFKGSYQELKRVIWPSRETTFRLTLVVIAISLAIAIILGAFDALFNFLLREALEAVRGGTL